MNRYMVQNKKRIGFQRVIFLLVLSISAANAFAFELVNKATDTVNSLGIDIHGFASVGYLDSNHNNVLAETEDGSFDFNEFGINFTKSFTNDLRFGFQLYSFDLGDVGDHEISIDWAFLDYHWKEWLGFRVGKIKWPYGLYNEQQDYDMLRTSILLPQGVYNKLMRETIISYLGAGLYGKMSLGPLGRLGYDIFYGTMDFEKEGGYYKIISTNSVRLDSADMEWAAGGRIKWYPPLDGLVLAATYGQLKIDQRLTSMNLPMKSDVPGEWFIFSAEYCIGNFVAAAEYFRLDFDVKSVIQTPVLPTVIESDFEPDSFYGSVSYRVNDWLSVGSYYSVFYRDRGDHDGSERVRLGYEAYDGWQKDLAFSTRFDINENWLFKLEYHFIDGTGLLSELDNSPYYSNCERKWELLALKVTFCF